mmetsp:Transcript_9920/g.36987  ORF Transcript_9920/g.36987 Transcript_9920/m.36987 type:complete len:708 (-) Transcript_9920:70-2193(-)
MGVLTEGIPLKWEQTSPEIRQYVKNHGVLQFLSNYKKNRDRQDEQLKWGDEIEYILVKADSQQKKALLSLTTDKLLKILSDNEKQYESTGRDPDMEEPIGSWKPEYGKFMIESTPYKPYGSALTELFRVEDNMRRRREQARVYLHDDEYLMCLSSFPLMGSLWADYITPTPQKPNHGPIADSYFVPDDVINPHIRFGTLTYNIRTRRESKVCILMPLFMDKHTNPQIGIAIKGERNLLENGNGISAQNGEKRSLSNGNTHHHHERTNSNSIVATIDVCECNETPTFCTKFIRNRQPWIYMDAMGFGMGCGCQQTTYQTRNMEEARYLYDHLVALCPLFLAVTASTPILRSLLADTDARWNVVSASVDDRVPDEKKKFLKSRYDSVSLFISNNKEAERFSDLNINVDSTTYDMVREEGLDHQLAKHIGHLFIRDPLVIFSDFREVDDETHTDHFENIQSTNWQTVRFKPPPKQDSAEIGWRVEFRVMELQLTDYGNASFSIFITLLIHAILKYNLKFYMPISKIDVNMCIAHRRDAVLDDEFYFVEDPFRKDEVEDIHSVYRRMSADEIFNGTKEAMQQTPRKRNQSQVTYNCDGSVKQIESHEELSKRVQEMPFIGLTNIVRKYVVEHGQSLSKEHRAKLEEHITFVSKRASGELQTPAHYIRNFVRSHPKYEFDSVVNEEIGYDLIQHLRAIQVGTIRPKELFGAC